MATIGLIFAVLFIYFRMDTVGMGFKNLFLYLVICTATALIGARLFFVIAMFPQMDITLFNVIYYLLNGGIVFYGGMLGVLLGIFVSSKIDHKEYIDVMNMIAPAIPLFHFFARIGCLFAGCCYGIPWGWGVVMMDDPDTIRFPVQLLESICNLLIFAIIMFHEHRKGKYAVNIRIYLICYAICRFVLEYFRGDSVRGIWRIGLSTAQIISLFILIYFVILGIKRHFLEKKAIDARP